MTNLNALIVNLTNKNVPEEKYGAVININIDYEVQCQTKDFISIKFIGSYKFKDSNENYLINYTVNYNLKDDKNINLQDVIIINENCLKKCKYAMENQLEKTAFEHIINVNDGSISYIFNKMIQDDYTYYITDNKLYLGV